MPATAKDSRQTFAATAFEHKGFQGGSDVLQKGHKTVMVMGRHWRQQCYV
jgi:hypothetical protein